MYKPDQGASQTPGDPAATFQLLDGVTIAGGYAGCGADDPDLRDVAAHQSVLSGDLLGNDARTGELRDLAESDPKRIEAMVRRYREFMMQLPEAEPIEGVDLPLDADSRKALEALGYLEPEKDES